MTTLTHFNTVSLFPSVINNFFRQLNVEFCSHVGLVGWLSSREKISCFNRVEQNGSRNTFILFLFSGFTQALTHTHTQTNSLSLSLFPSHGHNWWDPHILLDISYKRRQKSIEFLNVRRFYSFIWPLQRLEAGFLKLKLQLYMGGSWKLGWNDKYKKKSLLWTNLTLKNLPNKVATLVFFNPTSSLYLWGQQNI